MPRQLLSIHRHGDDFHPGGGKNYYGRLGEHVCERAPVESAVQGSYWPRPFFFLISPQPRQW